MIRPLSAAAGLLLALCIGIGARLETGAPPGLRLKPFAHLLDRQAPDFALPGLGGDTVSLASAGETDAWLLYFTDAACGACKAAYPAVAMAAEMLPSSPSLPATRICSRPTSARKRRPSATTRGSRCTGSTTCAGCPAPCSSTGGGWSATPPPAATASPKS